MTPGSCSSCSPRVRTRGNRPRRGRRRAARGAATDDDARCAAADRRGDAGAGRLHDQGLRVHRRREAAGGPHALRHAGHGAARCGRPRHQRGDDPSRDHRLGDAVPAQAAHRAAVRPRPAARPDALLRDHPRRSRPRRLDQAVGRAARAVPALRLCRSGGVRARADRRRTQGRPPAAGDGDVDGLHARVHVGGEVASDDGQRDGPGVPAGGDHRTQPDLAQDADRRDRAGSGMEPRRVHQAAARGRPRSGSPSATR